MVFPRICRVEVFGVVPSRAATLGSSRITLGFSNAWLKAAEGKLEVAFWNQVWHNSLENWKKEVVAALSLDLSSLQAPMGSFLWPVLHYNFFLPKQNLSKKSTLAKNKRSTIVQSLRFFEFFKNSGHSKTSKASPFWSIFHSFGAYPESLWLALHKSISGAFLYGTL